MKYQGFLFIGVLILTFFSSSASAHGIAGNRYFPPTISVDDPYAAYEVHAISGRTLNLGTPNSNLNNSNLVQFGFGLEPFDGFGIALDAVYRTNNPNLTTNSSGFDNLYYTIKKELTINDTHEFAISLGLNGQFGSSGGAGSNNGTSYAPTLFFAKGFGDLPSSLPLLKPLAITGTLGYQVSNDASQPNNLNWGFTLQYSFQYLNDYVQRTGWMEPFNRLVAVIEFPMQTCLSGICNGQVIGSVNPGVVWVGKYFNVNALAMFPVNNASGSGMGVLFQIHKYIGK